MTQKTTLAVFALLCIAALTGIASAALPDTATAKIDALTSWTGSSYWDVDVTGITGISDEINAGDYDWLGWCVDAQTTITEGTHTFTVFDSRNPGSLPSTYQSFQWNKINYVLNNKNGASMKAIQAALWHYDGGIPAGYESWFTGEEYDNLIADADANGATYVPGPGDVYAVVLYKANAQLIIIEVPVPYTNVPEFPTLAVPVGLMVGMVYAVSVAKGRKEETA
jgi:hypothetical protein